MKKSCIYCGRIHDKNFDCGKKTKRKFNKNTDKDKFRWTQAWQKKREEIKERDHYVCQYCLLIERTINYNKIEVHHIVKLEENFDLKLDENNLISLCSWHHKLADKGKIEKNKLYEILLVGNKIT